MVRTKTFIFLFFLNVFFIKPVYLYCYERVISLSPQVTESMYLLGADKILIANTTFCKRPLDAIKKEKIGTPQRPDIERIVSLMPDLVVGSQEGNQLWVIERIKRLGINTYFFKRPKNYRELSENFLILARLLNKEKKAEGILKEIETILYNTQKSKRFKVLWQVGSEPIVVATNSSFVNDVVEYAGGENIIKNEAPYMRVNIEEIIKNVPDIIVLMDMGYNVEGEKTKWKRYLKIKIPKFLILDPYVASSPTPVTFFEAVNELKKVF